MRFERTSIFIMVLMGVIFLGFSASCLFYFPVADSYQWYGDETWLLLAWRNMLLHGTMSVPIALGSTLHESSGLLTGSGWISAVLYGLPQLLASPEIDIVNIGRGVTITLAITTLILLLWAGRKLRVANQPIIFAVFLLLTTRSFTINSHSARYDIATGLAVLGYVIYFALQVKDYEEFSLVKWFAIGLGTTVLAFGVSPHLEVLLLPLSVYTAYQFCLFRSWQRIAAALGGVLLGLVILWGAFTLANGSTTLIGETKHGSEFFAVINNLPVRHLFSWSAQRRQLLAKGYYLIHEATAFSLIVLAIFASQFTLSAMRRIDATRTYLTMALVAVLFSSLFLQSTLPYYLMHVLPLMTLVFAMQLQEWRDTRLFRLAFPALAIVVSIVLVSFAVPGLRHARTVGRQLTVANGAAVQAAVEHVSRSWQPNTPKPLLLAQAPAIHELLRDTSFRLMSEAFLFFPAADEQPDSLFRRLGVTYVLDYHRPMTPEYQQAIWSMSVPRFSRAGALLDRSVDYFYGSPSPTDTLTLYEVTKTSQP